MFSGSAASEDNSAIDLIRESKRDGDIEVTLVMKGGSEPVTLTSDRDLKTTGLILNSGNSPEFVTINGQGRVIDLTGYPSGNPVITVQGGVTLTLRNITFKGLNTDTGESGNQAPVIKVEGGRIILDSGAVIEGNKGGNGGGAYVQSGKLVMNADSKISGNSTSLDGGGVFVGQGGSLVMWDGTIEKNAAASGGGVFVGQGGSFLMYDGTIGENNASSGGGVFVDQGGSFLMYYGTIGKNHAANGGGVFVDQGGTFNKYFGQITDNVVMSE
jgi:hypothetical protein